MENTDFKIDLVSVLGGKADCIFCARIEKNMDLLEKLNIDKTF